MTKPMPRSTQMVVMTVFLPLPELAVPLTLVSAPEALVFSTLHAAPVPMYLSPLSALLVGFTPLRLTVVPFASAPLEGLSFLVPDGIVMIRTLPGIYRKLSPRHPRALIDG